MTEVNLIKNSAEHLSDIISNSLARRGSVLWLVSGGSAIEVAVLTRKQIGDIPPEARLYVGLADERFGPEGHPDSNFKQLMDGGFDATSVTLLPVLADAKSREKCAADYDSTLTKLIQSVDLSVGLFGIGSDGHTAGILPHSPLVNMNKTLVSHYRGPDYERISATPLLISRLDEALLYSYGEEKWPAIKLFLQDGPIDEVPARILKMAKVYTLYTDYKGATK